MAFLRNSTVLRTPYEFGEIIWLLFRTDGFHQELCSSIIEGGEPGSVSGNQASKTIMRPPMTHGSQAGLPRPTGQRWLANRGGTVIRSSLK